VARASAGPVLAVAAAPATFAANATLRLAAAAAAAAASVVEDRAELGDLGARIACLQALLRRRSAANPRLL
jgi:hypothetical protein